MGVHPVTNIRVYSVAVANLIALIGGIIMVSAPFSNKPALLIGYYLVGIVRAGPEFETKPSRSLLGQRDTQFRFRSLGRIQRDIQRRSLPMSSLSRDSVLRSK